MIAADANLYDRFISKPNYKCFDTKVVGNMANPGSTNFNLGCFFSGHFFVECENKFYDPCLSTIYSSKEEPILYKASTINTGAVPMYAFGSGKTVIILRQLLGTVVPGFETTFEVLSPFKDDLKKKLTAQQYAGALQNRVLMAAGIK
ncbi:hypothetical protein LBMAG27_23170 [Bacteroidota bacterium]|nr:hypothetical protein LBMAG27_23170 [Bacteroidota bacterium]